MNTTFFFKFWLCIASSVTTFECFWVHRKINRENAVIWALRVAWTLGKETRFQMTQQKKEDRDRRGPSWKLLGHKRRNESARINNIPAEYLKQDDFRTRLSLFFSLLQASFHISQKLCNVLRSVPIRLHVRMKRGDRRGRHWPLLKCSSICPFQARSVPTCYK